MATNFLNFYRTGIAIDVAFVVGVLGVDCVAGEGIIYTSSGLFWGWAVDFWGYSPASFPLLSSLNKRRISSSFFHGPYITHNCGASCSSSGSSAGSSFNPS